MYIYFYTTCCNITFSFLLSLCLLAHHQGADNLTLWQCCYLMWTEHQIFHSDERRIAVLALHTSRSDACWVCN